MAANGIRKASMLLMSLDPTTAAELLGSADPKVIKQIAAEMAYLQAAGRADEPAPADLVEEFCTLLNAGTAAAAENDFVQKLLESTIGEEGSREVLGQVEDLIHARDPFLAVRSAGVRGLARALEGETAQTIATVLAELPPARSGQVLSILPEDVQGAVIRSMTSPESASAGAKARIASIVGERLQASRESGAEAGAEGDAEAGAAQREEKLRKVAVLLRGLEPAQREPLLESIATKDQETGQAVQGLMIIWEDIPAVADRSLQEALREVDVRKMALAVTEADGAAIAKLRANISERAGTLLDEELSLLSAPKQEDVLQAREDILQLLREMNSKGELEFEEG